MSASRHTHFPKGFAQGVTVRGMPLLSAYPGQVLWVSSVVGSDGNKGTFDRPLATLEKANTIARASYGDLVVALPGHVETVSAAAGLDLDTAGVAYLGLGAGSLRPTINFTTSTTADMDVDAANISMINFLFTGNVDALAAPIDVNAADFSLIGCEWRDVGATQATLAVLADANADRLLIDGWFHNGHASAGSGASIALVGMDNPVIRNWKIVGNFSVGCIDFRTTAVVDCDIHSGYGWNKNAADKIVVDTITASTGKIGPDIFAMLTDNAANITEAFDGATFHYFDPIYIVNLAGEKAMLTNIPASTDA